MNIGDHIQFISTGCRGLVVNTAHSARGIAGAGNRVCPTSSADLTPTARVAGEVTVLRSARMWRMTRGDSLTIGDNFLTLFP